MAKVQRHLSIHFNTRFFKGITHEEILNGIEKKSRIKNLFMSNPLEKSGVEVNG
jgi:hypothetical protein